MSDRTYNPLINRMREQDSRVHKELTEAARERLIQVIVPFVEDSELKRAHEDLQKDVALSELYDEQKITAVDRPTIRTRDLFHQADTKFVLYFIELALNDIYSFFPDKRKRGGFLPEAGAEMKGYDISSVEQVVDNIQYVLNTESILWRVEHEERRFIEFHKIESEAFEDVDKRVQALAQKDPWNKALRSYNDAFEMYSKGKFNEEIPKKLYHSIEEVLKTICVDLMGWTNNRELKHSKYLEMLDENQFYKAHGATTDEFGDFVQSLERMVAKISDERAQKHVPYHDRVYATLLIHQAGSYLYFLINRYEDYRS